MGGIVVSGRPEGNVGAGACRQNKANIAITCLEESHYNGQPVNEKDVDNISTKMLEQFKAEMLKKVRTSQPRRNENRNINTGNARIMRISEYDMKMDIDGERKGGFSNKEDRDKAYQARRRYNQCERCGLKARDYDGNNSA
ncbi:hypothetical protein GLOIN_2v1847961 [Rhizophagus irregularis DAOM 181602=DAOM 197198]|nr:hypothetical protein GLOIN_2v1847961 [Rhizophagus irregularis DAOM 181602=DAOM 197198]